MVESAAKKKKKKEKSLVKVLKELVKADGLSFN